MLAGLKRMIRSRAERSAARKYASLLGPQLRRDYGASEHYTTGQIKAAVTTCQLPPQYRSSSYAAFLSEEAFRSFGVKGDYLSLRLQFLRHVLSGAAPTFDPAPVNSYAVSGDGSSHHGVPDHGSF